MFRKKVICTKCSQEKLAKEFNKRSDKKNGLNSHCKECLRKARKTDRMKRSKAKYDQSEKAKETVMRYNRTEKNKAASRQYTKDNPEKRSSMNAVNHEVRQGRVPRAFTQACTDCGKQAQNYHHESYAKENRLNVIPLCVGCHHQRHRSS